MLESLFQHTPPEFSETRVREILQRHYFPDVADIDVQLKPLNSERDLNIRVQVPTGIFVLKIANRAERSELLTCQQAVLDRLSTAIPVLPVPKVIESISGQQLLLEEFEEVSHCVRLVTWLPGELMHRVEPTPLLLEGLGRLLGQLDRALVGFIHPGALRRIIWDLRHAGNIRDLLQHVEPGAPRGLAEHFLERFEGLSVDFERLPAAVIHNDANDHNVLVQDGCISGLIDFGDLVFTARVCELAVALAYVLMDEVDLMQSARVVIAAYHRECPLQDDELAVLYDLVALRLVSSIAISSWRGKELPENDYLMVSQKGALNLLERWRRINPQVAHFNFRAACGLEPSPHAVEISGFLGGLRSTRLGTDQQVFADILPISLRLANKRILSYRAGPDLLAEQQAASLDDYSDSLWRQMSRNHIDLMVGRYMEDRAVYQAAQFVVAESAESRTVHTGIDLFMPAGTPVFSPLDGIVFSLQDNSAPQDYGTTLILQHQTESHRHFYTLYGHLAHKTLSYLQPAQMINAGDTLGWLGNSRENGGWVPHLHFQVMTDMLGLSGNFPGVCARNQVDVWRSICIDPNLILDMTPESFDDHQAEEDDVDELLSKRMKLLGGSLSVSYRHPIKVVRGEGCHLFDQFGRGYLDCVNNISHVGHCHPHVVKALQEQAARLNTNTRYLHENIVNYAARLTERFPDPLNVCLFVCTGSEANELALRMAEAATGQTHMLSLDAAYHGNTRRLIDISPYKHDGPGGNGPGQDVTILPLPDRYRGKYRSDTQHGNTSAGVRYAEQAGEIVAHLVAQGKPPAAFIAESLPGCGGQIVLPDGYLREIYRHVRKAGGVCIADEVQVGFGRVGDAFWGFELQGVVPDIVTLGKPMGNGHPLACVVTSREIADAFANGMEYFNSFGGNPVSCAVGLAVLEVIETEGLQARARDVGMYLMQGLKALQQKFSLIGDVRGSGLYIGLELVKNSETLEPAAQEADQIINGMRERGILLSTDGPLHNVLKIKPPLVFSRRNADQLCWALNEVMGAL